MFDQIAILAEQLTKATVWRMAGTLQLKAQAHSHRQKTANGSLAALPAGEETMGWRRSELGQRREWQRRMAHRHGQKTAPGTALAAGDEQEELSATPSTYDLMTE